MRQDLKIHYVRVHLHPFAESLQLRDVTTGQTVLASKAENRPERIGLARVEQIASPRRYHAAQGSSVRARERVQQHDESESDSDGGHVPVRRGHGVSTKVSRCELLPTAAGCELRAAVSNPNEPVSFRAVRRGMTARLA